MNHDSSITPLPRVRVGDEGFLSFVGAADTTIQRLMSMGLIPNAFVRVIRVAPLGDPIMLEIGGTQVCVRRREAAALALRPTSTAGPGAGATDNPEMKSTPTPDAGNAD